MRTLIFYRDMNGNHLRVKAHPVDLVEQRQLEVGSELTFSTEDGEHMTIEYKVISIGDGYAKQDGQREEVKLLTVQAQSPLM